MRLLLALVAAASLAACSKNHANVKTGPETGRVSISGSATGTVDTSSASGAASDTASTQAKPDSM